LYRFLEGTVDQYMTRAVTTIARQTTCANSASSFVELRFWSVVVRQSGSTFHLPNNRIKRAVGMLRGAEITQACVRLGSKSFEQRCR
jgi:hypothetical protein